MIDEWLLCHLVCPQDRNEVFLERDSLKCASGHIYSIVDGIPVMLFDDGSPTHAYITRTLEKVERIRSDGQNKDLAPTVKGNSGQVDPFVQREIPYTCGNLYFSVQGKMDRYPIPDVRFPDGGGERLLDVGCNWGRWTIAAAQHGYAAVGIDPSLDAIMAARRVSRQLGVKTSFVVGDARFLPFSNGAFERSFSYSVLQHFKKQNAKIALREISRVTVPGGPVLIQMANKYGIRSFYQRLRLGFKDGKEGTDVFYWSPRELKKTFEEIFGKTRISVDCFFGLNVQSADADMLPFKHKMIIGTSEFMRRLSSKIWPLERVADSLYLASINRAPP